MTRTTSGRAVPPGWLGQALTHRAIGRLAGKRNDLAAAEADLAQACENFETIEALYEAARTLLDRAEVARGRQGLAAAHAADAYRAFVRLGLPYWVGLTTELARDLEVTLPADGAGRRSAP